MSFHPWLSAYLCVATLVVAVAMAFAAWSRRDQPTDPGDTVGPALLAGALWPLVVAGLAEWLLVHAVGNVLRRESAPALELIGADGA